MSDLVLPSSFPQRDYTPFGYLDNPYHSAIEHRSGILRSVPPMGFGFWCRRFPWPYGEGARRQVNYLSFLHLSVCIDGSCFHESGDFRAKNVFLSSRYHTKTLMSYDWEFEGVAVSAKYFLASENALVCLLELKNEGESEKEALVYASNLYGHPELRWWGSDGLATNFNASANALVTKMWAYGDVFAIGADQPSQAHKATPSREEWESWVRNGDLSSLDAATVDSPEQMIACQSYTFKLPPKSSQKLTLCLTRGTNELYTVREHQRVLENAVQIAQEQLQADQAFYEQIPLLEGDWPEDWLQGWIYDFETIRMTIRPPVGIFKHHWDGMQVFTPRSVLGEAMYDSMCLSYADAKLAKEVILGTFADAPMPNIPCVREDGSMNMIGAGGAECGTAPIWGLPFHMIRSIYERDQDKEWIAEVYPHLKSFVEWWLEHRTDEDGWFFCNNSWESGQDGSKRFLIKEGEEGKEAEFVRTVDVEAAMANAFDNLAYFANLAGHAEDAHRWRTFAQERLERTRAMYHEGWFRDWDARTEQPIVLEDYWDVQMFMPLSLNLATPEQMKTIEPKFRFFIEENSKLWLEWPTFLYTFTEAAWNSGQRELAAETICETGDRIYARTAYRDVKPMGETRLTLPEPYHFRIPGVSAEFWPIELYPGLQNGCENYGWGATLPTMILRSVLGFREANDENAFTLAPSLPDRFLGEGKRLAVNNLRYRDLRFDVTIFRSGNEMRLEITFKEGQTPASVTDEQGNVYPVEAGKTQAVIKSGSGLRVAVS